MLLPEKARAILTKRYRRLRCEWLSGEGRWPLTESLGCPTEQQAQRQPEAVREWAAAWRGIDGVEWSERRWRSLGSQSVPERLVLRDAGALAEWIGEGPAWRRAHERYSRLGPRWPRLSRYFEVLSDYPDADIERLAALLDWLERNPDSQLYPRQLPIAGLDTKWLEPRKPLLADLRGNADFGFRPLPHLVRLRVLDDTLRRQVGAIGDLSASLPDLARLDLPAARVYIIENLQTGLALGEEPGAVVFLGLGYGVNSLAHLPWVVRTPCIYWGDIDTHGFAILDRARMALPQLESVLMDEETLLAHRELWGFENEPHPASELPLLNAAEQAVYRGLKEQRWGFNLRLEQERIAWSYARARYGLSS